MLIIAEFGESSEPLREVSASHPSPSGHEAVSSAISTSSSAFVALATTAYAADTSSSSSNPTTTNVAANQESTQNLPNEIQSKLQQDGFTDVKVVPGSFLVSAKDKRGEPVTMIIGPHSMVIMTVTKMGNSSNSGSNGSAESGGHAK